MAIQVFINGSMTEVTKQQLFALAARNAITPDTAIIVNGTHSKAGRVKDIAFGGGSEIHQESYEILLHGIPTKVTKPQLQTLATQGIIGADTPVTINGKLGTAGMVEGIQFGTAVVGNARQSGQGRKQNQYGSNTPQASSQPVPHSTVQDQDNEQLIPADPALRLCAHLIDAVLSVVLLFIMGFIIFTGHIPSIFTIIVLLLLPLTVQWHFLSRSSSIGKDMMGLYVVDIKTWQPLGLGYMVLREFIGKWISGMIFSLGFIWILIDKDKQGWHDKLVNSIVVKRPQQHSAVQDSTVQDNEQLIPANPTLRLSAGLIDWGLFIVMCIVIGISLTFLMGSLYVNTGSFIGMILLPPFFYVIVWAYFWSHRSSIGKYVLGLHVVDSTTGLPLGLIKMLRREIFGKLVATYFFWYFWWLDYVWIFIDRNMQGWHDKLVGSIVVKRPKDDDET